MADAQPKRTIGAKKKIGGDKGGASAPAPAPAEEAAPAAPKKKSKKLLLMGAGALVLVGGGYFAYSNFLAPDDAAATEGAQAEEVAPELGAVVPLEDPISVNLAEGRYLRLGYALQLPKSDDGEEAGPDVSRTRDIAITTFSGRPVEQINDPEQREQLRGEFLSGLQATFGESEVLDVYFTDFVTQ